jgi:hypothetical protein
MANPFGDYFDSFSYGSSNSSPAYVPIPTANPAFHNSDPIFGAFTTSYEPAPYSAPASGSGGGGFLSNIFEEISGGIRGIGSVFTAGLDSAGDIARSYQNYDSIVNPKPQGIKTEHLLMIGGGILLVAMVLK